jgi:SP family myo-inositol transporter-like MFS transporter 13
VTLPDDDDEADLGGFSLVSLKARGPSFSLYLINVTPFNIHNNKHHIHGSQSRTLLPTTVLDSIALADMADSAEVPLMRHDSATEDEPSHDVDLNDVSLLLEKNLRHPGLFVWLLTFSAGISGLLFGYDTGVISATLVSINSSLGHPLTTLDKSLITSATALFALLVSPVSGILADALGRKKVVLLADSAFILGAIVQAATSSVPGMIAGRSIVGLAVGAGSFVAPLYIAELAPAPFRGRLVTLNVLFITIGQVVAYIVGWAFVQWGSESTNWRWMVGLGALPAAIQCLIMIVMPETPRWLVKVDRHDEGRSVLNKVFKGIVNEVREEEEAKRGRLRSQKKKGTESWFASSKDNWKELFRTGGNRRALAIACLLQGLQQLCGFVRMLHRTVNPELTFLTELFDVLLCNHLYNPRI